jgi:hypothetical protein
MGHTPGPWKSKPGANDANMIADADGRAVATVYFRDDGADTANRDLVIAAPDLLAFARSMLSTTGRSSGHFYDCNNGKRGGVTDDHDSPTGAACSNACIELRAAIAKAEGSPVSARGEANE